MLNRDMPPLAASHPTGLGAVADSSANLFGSLSQRVSWVLGKLADYAHLCRSPEGRDQIDLRLPLFLFPALAGAASLYRGTLGAKTRMTVVIGSYGKSTTTRVTRAALGLGFDKTCDLNLNSDGQVPLKMLRDFPPRRHNALEVGIDGPGQMSIYARLLRPDVVVVTSLGYEHVQSFENLEHVRDEKANMVRALGPSGVAVLNGDDPNVLWMASQTIARVMTFGLSDRHDVYATDVQLDWPNGTRFELHANGKSQSVYTRLIGRPMLYSVLAGCAAGVANGRSLKEIAAGIATLKPTPGRLQAVRLPMKAVALCDEFKASVDTVHAALDVLEQIPAERKFVLMGDMEAPHGPEQAHYREVGERVGQIANRVIYIGEKFKRARVGFHKGGMTDERITRVYGVHDAAEILGQELRPGDVVLLKGRGSQRLSRVVLALQGRKVGCKADPCRIKHQTCRTCPLLRRDWQAHSRVTIFH